MKKFKFLIFPLIIFGSIFLFSKTEAAVSYNNYDYQASGPAQYGFTIATSTYGFSTISSTTSYYFECANPVEASTDIATSVNYMYFNNANALPVYDFPIINAPPGNWYSFDSPITFTNSDGYLYGGSTYPYVKIKCSGNENGNLKLYAASGDQYPVIDFLYPENSSVNFIHDFTSFSFSVQNNDDATNLYRFRIYYDTTSTFSNEPIRVSRNIVYTILSGATHYLNIPKPQPLATSTQYWAKLCVLPNLETDEVCGEPITFKTGNFTTGFRVNTDTAGWFGSTTTEAGILNYNGTSTSIEEMTGLVCDGAFYDPRNWVCHVGQQIIRTWNYLKDFAFGIFEAGTDSLQVVFPINILSQFSADLASVSATTTDSSLVITGEQNAFKKAVGGYYSFTFLTSSTLGQIEGNTGWDWEQFVVYLLWAITGMFIVGSAYAIIQGTRKKDNA